MNPPLPPKASKQAVWSLVLGILSNTCLWLLGSIPAIILGISGMKKADADPQNVGGRGMSLAGIITGSVGVFVGFLPVMTALGILASLSVPAFSSMSQQAKLTEEQNSIRQVLLGCQAYASDNDGVFPPNLRVLGDDYLFDPSAIEIDGRDGTVKEILYRPGLTLESGFDEPVLLSPNTYPSGRVVGFLDGRVDVLNGPELAEAEGKFAF